jgi:23S rRNA pseudouridine1911/1915/1917 synthase
MMSTGDSRIRKTVKVGPGREGMRFDQAAAELFDDYSRARLQKWIRSGELCVDGQARKPTYRVLAGEVLELDAVPEPVELLLPQDIPLDIIFVDDDLIVLNKPAGLVVHPAAGNPDGTLLNEDTSGIMVVARSLGAHNSLVRQLQSREMSRIYRALVMGELISGGTVEAPIGRHPRDRKRMAVVPGGRPAVSRYRIIERLQGLSYVEVRLETGRTHQIRVHMAHIGHPIVGDPVYGRASRQRRGMPEEVVSLVREFPRQALHALEIGLMHPASGAPIRFEAPLPGDLESLLAALRALSG